MTVFRWPVRVYYEDTDGGGVVYHANYLKFMERARTELLRSHGFDQTVLRRREGVLFVVRAMQLKFRQPAHFDDALEVVTQLASVGRSLMKFRQDIWRGREHLTEATVEVVCVDAERLRPVAIPSSIKVKITESQ